MRGKLIMSLVLAVFLLSACQIPQYNQPADAGDDVTKQIEELTTEIEDENSEDSAEMTPEEKAREEFKRRLLERQMEAREAAKRAASNADTTDGLDGSGIGDESNDNPDESMVKDSLEDEKDIEEKKVEPVVKNVEDSSEEKLDVKDDAPVGQTITKPTRVDGKLRLAVKETDTVALNLKGTDPDGDALTYTFGSPLDTRGRWITKVGDAGDYEIKISVSDGQASVEDVLHLSVIKLNNAPTLEMAGSVSVNEGETITLDIRANDADGDVLSYSYSGWMTSPTKQTGYSDSGEHSVKVTVSDGKDSVSKTVQITVNDVNRPPSFTFE